MANKKLTDVDVSNSFDSVFVNDGNKVRQINKETYKNELKGKSAYQYAQDGGYTGTEEEFAQKLAAEYPTDVQINGTSIVSNKIADITTQKIRIVRELMDEVAIADAVYLLGELAELSVVLPDDALVGQEITVSWYNGDTPSTLSVAGNMLDFDYVPDANTRSEISCLWDGTYWSVIGMSQDVPVEEVVASE